MYRRAAHSRSMASSSLFVRAAAALLTAVVSGCSGDPGSPGARPDAVASVVVTGAPALLMVGDSARLVATAVNATGGIVSNQNVTWRSSNAAVAAVSSNGTVIGLGAGTAIITATASERSGTAALDVRAGGTVGTEGGTLTANGGALSLSIPTGALTQATPILLRPAVSPPTDARLLTRTAFEVGPDGLIFRGAATLSLRYDASQVPSQLAEASLQLYFQSGSAWGLIGGSTVNATTRTVTGRISRSGVYAVRSTPVDRVVLSGAAVGGALYVAQSSQVMVRLLDAIGDSLTGRPITWASSDANRATVDATGKVIGIGAGAVTITASADGKVGTTVVTVLARPATDWSRAAEWTTFQGNAGRSGFVDATVDPTLFTQRWLALTNMATSGLAIGDGTLFASSAPYGFNGARLLALSIVTGTEQWRRDFNVSYGVNPPTYDNGTVYLATGGQGDTYMFGLNASDGSIRFQTPFTSQWEHWRAPLVVGRMVLAAGGTYGGMYAFDRVTGARAYFVPLPQVANWTPAAANGVAYSFSAIGLPGELTAYDPTTGSVLYRIVDSRLPISGSPVLGGTNDVLVVAGGWLVSVNLQTRAVRWAQSGLASGIPVVGNGVIYVVANKQVEARRESDGTLLWTWSAPVGSVPLGNMIVTNNILFVGTAPTDFSSKNVTYAVDLGSHLTTWSYPLGGELALSGQGILFIAGQGAALAAINLR